MNPSNNPAIAALREEYGSSLAALSEALEAGDELQFMAMLDALVQRREHMLFDELRKLTCNLQSALDGFRADSRLIDMVQKDVPDAHYRLDHVLKLTDEAAHRTMDLVERSRPLAEHTMRDAAQILALWRRFRSRSIAVDEFRSLTVRMDEFLDKTRADMALVRGNLSEVLLAQGYQDLTGQIIRGVMKLVRELELALRNLVQLSGTSVAVAITAISNKESSSGFGPVIPGVDQGPAVSGQQDVDALLSGLGM